MKKLAILVVAAVIAAAQDKGAPGPAPLAPGEVIRVVPVKNGGATNISDNLGRIFPGISRAGSSLIVRGTPDVANMIEDAIKKLDVPSPESQPVPNVELTVQLLLGSAQEIADAKVPADLDATVRQLKTIFPYKSYRVLDTQILRSRSSGQNLEASGTLPGGQSYFDFHAQTAVNPGPAPRSVRITNLRLNFRQEVKTASNTFQYQNSGINTELDAREGQKTVVGKSNIANSDDAIILVITPKVIE